MDKLSKQEQDFFKEAFRVFDKDGDGEITWKELGEVMRSLNLNPSDQELQDMVNEVDTDHTGTIDIHEFLAMMNYKASVTNTEEELRQAFQVFDKDKSGTISVSEMRDVLKALGENLTDAEIDDIMNAADTDGDKSIDFEEFKKIMQDSV